MNGFFYLMLIIGLVISAAMSVVLVAVVRRQLFDGELHLRHRKP